MVYCYYYHYYYYYYIFCDNNKASKTCHTWQFRFPFIYRDLLYCNWSIIQQARGITSAKKSIVACLAFSNCLIYLSIPGIFQNDFDFRSGQNIPAKWPRFSHAFISRAVKILQLSGIMWPRFNYTFISKAVKIFQVRRIMWPRFRQKSTQVKFFIHQTE